MKHPLAVLAIVFVVTWLTGALAHGAEEPSTPDQDPLCLATPADASGGGSLEGERVRLEPGTLGGIDKERGVMVTVPETRPGPAPKTPRAKTAGTRRHTRSGFFIGAAAGATAVLVQTRNADCTFIEIRPCSTEDRVLFAAIGAGALGGIGALVGHFVR
jgi:hypothetical protein